MFLLPSKISTESVTYPSSGMFFSFPFLEFGLVKLFLLHLLFTDPTFVLF